MDDDLPPEQSDPESVDLDLTRARAVASDEPFTHIATADVTAKPPPIWRRHGVPPLVWFVFAPLIILCRFLVQQWRLIDADSPLPTRRGFDYRVLVILVMCAVSLTLQEYVGDRGVFERWFPLLPHHFDRYYQLKELGWWCGWRFGGYLVLPILVILALPGERLRDYHFSLRGFWKHLPIYAGLFFLVLPAVILASHTQEFRDTYPFYRLAHRSLFDLFAWEAMYALQFLSLEVFFRGFMLQGLRRHLGSNAVFVMIIPYCMIHYGKPMPETFGAIGAGIILGTLAMRTRSIWGGVVIHVAVATTMDMLALGGCPPFGSGRVC